MSRIKRALDTVEVLQLLYPGRDPGLLSDDLGFAPGESRDRFAVTEENRISVSCTIRSHSKCIACANEPRLQQGGVPLQHLGEVLERESGQVTVFSILP